MARVMATLSRRRAPLCEEWAANTLDQSTNARVTRQFVLLPYLPYADTRISKFLPGVGCHSNRRAQCSYWKIVYRAYLNWLDVRHLPSGLSQILGWNSRFEWTAWIKIFIYSHCHNRRRLVEGSRCLYSPPYPAISSRKEKGNNTYYELEQVLTPNPQPGHLLRSL
jgi:hypothetical protein